MQRTNSSRYGIMEGTAPAFEVVPSIQKPDEPLPGKLLDSHGDTVHPVKRGWMVRIDAKASEKVEVSKGMLAMIAFIPAILLVLFNYGAGALGWARDDEAGRVKMTNIERQVEDLNRKFDDIQKSLQAQAIQSARGEGYKLGVTESQADHGKKEK